MSAPAEQLGDAVLETKDVQMQVEQPAQPTEAPSAAPPADQAPPAVPEGFVPYSESTTSILFAAPPSSSEQSGSAPVFLNPVQQYNRDLSVVAIRTWSEARQREKRAFWEEGIRRKRERKRTGGAGGEGKGKGKKRKAEDGAAVEAVEAGESAEAGAAEGASAVEAKEAVPVEDKAPAGPTDESAADAKVEHALPPPPTYKFTLLEALSATGLRAIRYAKELPLLRYVVANDLSASAVKDIERNVAFNRLEPKGVLSLPGTEGMKEEDVKPLGARSKADIDEARLGKVRVNEGDACVYMYQHRNEDKRFDCIDLDPYGSAVPFLDSAMNAIADGGLMCVTCTDMGVLAGHNYPEKAFTHYGGVCVNAEYSHEVALRLVLNALATTAARYGRYIEPQLSLSIDFYVRLFIRVRTAPKEVKALASKTSLVFYCHTCQTPHWQAFGRVSEKTSAKTGAVNYSYHVPAGPPKGVDGERCGECGGKFHIGGPMWSAPLHNQAFIKEMLEHVEENKKDFATHDRIKGMLTVALNECEAPLYFSPAKMASLFNAVCPPISTFGSALLNGGYTASRSHAVAGSIKTDAPRSFVHDVIREWIKEHPVKMANVKDGSPAKVLLAKEMRHEVSLKHHPDAGRRLLDDVKVVRYQMNPQANWGPARAAVRGAPLAKKGGQ